MLKPFPHLLPSCFCRKSFGVHCCTEVMFHCDVRLRWPWRLCACLPRSENPRKIHKIQPRLMTLRRPGSSVALAGHRRIAFRAGFACRPLRRQTPAKSRSLVTQCNSRAALYHLHARLVLSCAHLGVGNTPLLLDRQVPCSRVINQVPGLTSIMPGRKVRDNWENVGPLLHQRKVNRNRIKKNFTCTLTRAPPLAMQVADLDGLAHYKALGISKSANEETIKKASEIYRHANPFNLSGCESPRWCGNLVNAAPAGL